MHGIVSMCFFFMFLTAVVMGHHTAAVVFLALTAWPLLGLLYVAIFGRCP